MNLRTNTRNPKSIIDYVVTNRHIHLQQVLDHRTLNPADIGINHSLLLRKIRTKFRIYKNLELTTEIERINVETLWDSTAKELYEKRLKGIIKSTSINEQDGTDLSWGELKRVNLLLREQFIETTL